MSRPRPPAQLIEDTPSASARRTLLGMAAIIAIVVTLGLVGNGVNRWSKPTPQRLVGTWSYFRDGVDLYMTLNADGTYTCADRKHDYVVQTNDRLGLGTPATVARIPPAGTWTLDAEDRLVFFDGHPPSAEFFVSMNLRSMSLSLQKGSTPNFEFVRQ